MDKKELRRTIRERKRAMTEEEIIARSEALGVLFADPPGTLYAVRKDSPLIVGRTLQSGGPHGAHAGTGSEGRETGGRAQGLW